MPVPPFAARVTTLAVYPIKERPGDRLRSVFVEPEGLQGDRPKKRPVHVVGREETPDTTRANIFLDASNDELQALVGTRLAIGDECVLTITEIPKNCPGVYADVTRFGVIALGYVATTGE